MSNSTFGIDITGRNMVEKGAKAAEKRLGQIPKYASQAQRRAMAADERDLRSFSRGIVRTFAEVERSSARAFGTGSLSGGLTRRLGGLSLAGRATGLALGEAAAGAGLLEKGLIGVGAAAASGVGLLAAAAVAALKVADSFGKGVLAAGNLAKLIGVSTKQLTEFQAAAERVGVDKNTAAGALGGLSQNLNDARYGRNSDVLALLAKLGVGMRLNADGTVNTMGMAPAIADALSRQNSSGARTMARILGIPDAAIPAFRQGGRALSRDMADAGRNAFVLDENDVALGARLTRRHAKEDQWKERNLLGPWRRGVAGGVDTIEGAIVDVVRGNKSFDQAARDVFRPATERFERAVGMFAGGAGGGGLRNGVLNLSPQDVIDLKKTVATEWNKSSVAQGRGVIDTILNRYASGHWGNSIAAVVNSRKQFSDVNGPPAWAHGRHSVAEIPMTRIDPKTNALVDQWLAARAHGGKSIIGDNLDYANPFTADRRNREGWMRELHGPTFGSGQSVHTYGTTNAHQRLRPGDFQVSSPGQTVHLEHHVTVEDRRTTVKSTVRNDTGRAPAVSYSYSPARGG